MKTENYNGSDCTGSDGGQNRTLTISNTHKTDNNNLQIFVNNSFLHLNTDYTIVHNESGTIITFLNYLWDDQYISVIYQTTGRTSSSGETGILPLDTQLINNEITCFGDTITLRKVTNLDYDKRGNSQEVLGDSKISYTSNDDALQDFYGANWISQTFTTDSAINTTSAKIKIKRTGTPSTITIGIQALDVNSKPDGTDLTSGSLDYVDLIDDGDTEWITIPLDDYTLSASTTYALVIREASGDATNKYQARIVTTGTYSGGNILTSDDSGYSWTIGTSDILFDLYGDTETIAITNILTFDDDVVKNGIFQSGDIRLFFQSSEDIDRGDLIKFRNVWYAIDSIAEDSCGDTTYSLDCVCKKI
ncbi:MAG: hypothetical protein ACFFG0_03105 [Candidatus Thorarchaeota archaeon]